MVKESFSLCTDPEFLCMYHFTAVNSKATNVIFFIVLIFGQQTEIAPLTSYPYNVSRYCATSGMLTFTSPQSTGMHSGGVFVHFSPSQVLFGVLKRESLLLRYLIINEEFSSFEILHPDRSRCVGTNEHVDCRRQH